ncbi:Uncharacterized protein FKW44_007726, partial [Caligus rogercresseyi]
PLEPEHLKQNYQETSPRKKPVHPPPRMAAPQRELTRIHSFPRLPPHTQEKLNGTLRTPTKSNGAYHSHP